MELVTVYEVVNPRSRHTLSPAQVLLVPTKGFAFTTSVVFPLVIAVIPLCAPPQFRPPRDWVTIAEAGMLGARARNAAMARVAVEVIAVFFFTRVLRSGVIQARTNL